MHNVTSFRLTSLRAALPDPTLENNYIERIVTEPTVHVVKSLVLGFGATCERSKKC